MTKRMLITGASGYLGRHIAAMAVGARWAVTGTHVRKATPLARERLDVRDPRAIHALVDRVRPDVVVHAAAGRDRADWATNADGAAHVALAAARAQVKLIHISSDAIFSGRDVHYDESAQPDPVHRYGASKAAAETAVRAIVPESVVIRTSLIMGDGHGQHEVFTHALASGRITGALFTDEVRMPVHVTDLAAAVVELAASDYQGVLNVAGTDAVNRYDLGLLVAARDGLDPARLLSGRVADFGSPRPADVRLNTDRAQQVLRTRLRGAREFLAA